MTLVSTFKTKSAREYNRLAMLQEKTQNEWDGRVSWEQIDDLYVAVRPRTARLAVDGVQETEVIRYDVYTPWNPDAARLLAKVIERRLVVDDRVLYVESVIDMLDEHAELKIICTERPHG